MADEESPYEGLDVGYVEWPMPTTQELNLVRFLDKSGVTELWGKINDKFFRIPYGGSVGQVLTKTDSGFGWKDVQSGDFIENPEGGAPGQALIKTESGYAWQDVVVDIPEIPNATSEVYGLVKFASDEDFENFINSLEV